MRGDLRIIISVYDLKAFGFLTRNILYEFGKRATIVREKVMEKSALSDAGNS